MSSTSCPICFEPFVGKFRATPDVCKHIFCMPCLQTWSKTDNVCPIDRKKFKKIINLDSDSIIQIKPRKRRPKRVFYDITSYCEVCKVSNNGDVMLLCDSCDLGYHSKCLTPPLSRIPNNAWNCPECAAIDRRLRANNSRTKDRTLTIKYAKKSKKESGCTVSKTKELRIHYNSKKQHGHRGPASKMERSPKQGQNFDDQPGPSTSTVSTEDDDIDVSHFDFETSSSDDSADEISDVIADFHQQVELGNKEMSEERSPLIHYDEFQDFDFKVFSDNEESMPVSSEPCNSATSACKDAQFDMESNDSFDIDINFDSSSENSESEVQDSKVSIEKPSKYKLSENGCYFISPKKIKNESDCVRKSEVSSCAKHNNPSTNNFDSLYPKIDFMKSLKETRDLNQAMKSYVMNHNVIDNAKESEESLHAQHNIPTINDLNFSSAENVFKKSGNQPGRLNIRNDSRSVSSNEKSEIDVDNVKPLSDSLHEKQDHSLMNNLTPSSENDFMNNLKRHLKRINNSSWGSLIEEDNGMEPEESLPKQKAPKEDTYLNRTIDLSSEKNQSGINSIIESDVKPSISNINDLNVSSCKNKFMKNLKSARELKWKNNIKSHFKVTSPIKKAKYITNEAGSQVKSEILDDYEPDAISNSCNTANSTFEESNFTSTSVSLENSSSISLENEMDVFDKHKEELCLDDVDSCNTTSSESSESKAILLKLPLRLSFKKRASKTSEQSATTSTDNISASICTIASVASMQHLDSETAVYSDANLLSDSSTFSTYSYLHQPNSASMGDQINSNLSQPSTSVPITFSLIEEQMPKGNTDCFYSTDSIHPWSNFFSMPETSPETSPTKKLKRTDYTLNMEKSGNLIIPSNASHLFGKQIFVKDMKQLSIKKDGALFLNWKHSDS